MLDGGQDREWGEASHGTEGAIHHQFTEVCQQRHILVTVLTRHNLIDNLDASGRADATGGTFAATFEGAEFHGEAGLLRQVYGVIENDDATVAEHALAGGEGFVVEGRVEKGGWEYAPRGPPTCTARTGRPLAVPPPKSSTA